MVYTSEQVKGFQEAAAARRAANPQKATPLTRAQAIGSAQAASEASSATPTTPISASSPSVPRNIAAETETISKIGRSPSSDQEMLDAALMTYGNNLPDEFKKLQESLANINAQNAEQIKAGISKMGQAGSELKATAEQEAGASPMRLNVLQQALRRASSVGSQELGKSDIFQKAADATGATELLGYGALASSLATRSDEMNYKYDNFSNVIGQIANSMAAQNTNLLSKAKLALDSYDQLRGEYEFERKRMDDIEAKKKDYEQQMEYLAKQNEYELGRMEKSNKLALELETEKSQIMSPTEWIEYAAKQQEYWDAIGYTPGMIPESDTYSISQTATGVTVDDIIAGQKTGQCGKLVNDLGFVTADGQRMFGDSYESKAKWIDANIKVPEAGMAFVMKTESPYGHVGFVESVDAANGTMTVLDSNWSGDEKAQRRIVPISSVAGFVRPPGAVSVDSSTGGLYDQYYSQAIKEGVPADDAQKFATDRIKEAYQPMTEAQGKAFNAYVIMNEEEDTYKSLMEGVNPEAFGDAINFISRKMKEGDTLTSDLVRQYVSDSTVSEAINSELRWLEGALREESGAVITVDEYKQKGAAYFPRPGDSATEIARKEKLRTGIVKSKYAKMGASGQRQYEQSFGGADEDVSADEDSMLQDLMDLYDNSSIVNEFNSLWE